jgi:hypothetical protein
MERDGADELAAARTELRRVISDLDSLRFRLLGVRSILPESPMGSIPEEDLPEVPDEASTLRDEIANLVVDRLNPAITDLEALLGVQRSPANPQW